MMVPRVAVELRASRQPFVFSEGGALVPAPALGGALSADRRRLASAQPDVLDCWLVRTRSRGEGGAWTYLSFPIPYGAKRLSCPRRTSSARASL